MRESLSLRSILTAPLVAATRGQTPLAPLKGHNVKASRRHAMGLGALAVLLCVTFRCKTTDAPTTETSGATAAPVWRDVSTTTRGFSARCERVEVDALCAFEDGQTGLIWSNPATSEGRGLATTLAKARAFCQGHGRGRSGKDSGWRLPSRIEYEAATRDQAGMPRRGGMIAFGDVSPEFGKLVAFQSLWTDTLESPGSRRAWAVQRFGEQVIFALSPETENLPFRCVRSRVVAGITETVQVAPARRPAPAASSSPTATSTVTPTFTSTSTSTSTSTLTTTPTTTTTPTSASASATSDSQLAGYSLDQLRRTPESPWPTTARHQITANLERIFSEKQLDSHLLTGDGDLVIAPASGFVFGETSGDLPREQLAELTAILKVYVRVLAATSVLDGTAPTIEVIGYASPSYQGRPQSGFDPENLADIGAVYNRIIGMKRADAVARLIEALDDEMTVVRVSMGSLGGVVDASGPNGKCGEFDCIASRRVVVRFHPGLKGESGSAP